MRGLGVAWYACDGATSYEPVEGKGCRQHVPGSRVTVRAPRSACQTCGPYVIMSNDVVLRKLGTFCVGFMPCYDAGHNDASALFNSYTNMCPVSQLHTHRQSTVLYRVPWGGRGGGLEARGYLILMCNSTIRVNPLEFGDGEIRAWWSTKQLASRQDNSGHAHMHNVLQCLWDRTIRHMRVPVSYCAQADSRSALTFLKQIEAEGDTIMHYDELNQHIQCR